MDRTQRESQESEFTAFVLARSRSLLGSAQLLAGDRQRGEDLLQTALLKAYLAWPRLRRQDAIEAYVRRTMVTTSISWWRRRWQAEVPTADLPESRPSSSPDPVELIDGRAEIWPYLVALPPRQRVALVLRYYEDLTEQQIADLMECSVGTVKSQLHRALATLRTRIAESHDEDTMTRTP